MSDTIKVPTSDVREVLPRGGPGPIVELRALDRYRWLAERAVGTLVAFRYHLLGVLGVGAAGAVYVATHMESGREVAVKVLHESLSGSPEHVARFHREARVMAAIGHPAVAEVFDIGCDSDGCCYIAMERLQGELLFDVLNHRRLSVPEVIATGRQLLSVLEVAHARGILHRDVKPENIIVTRGAKGELDLKLLDFGIAKWLRRADRAAFATADGVIMGTPQYMSPEMCVGKPLDEGADLWSAAVVLFHALAGAPPFDDESIGRLLWQIVHGQVPSLAKYRPGLPPELTAVIDRALTRDKARRWPSAAAFRAALSRAGAPYEQG